MPARRTKTDYASTGFPHREHRSKKGRQNKKNYDFSVKLKIDKEKAKRRSMDYEANKIMREFNYE